jgi:hypothetical protein
MWREGEIDTYNKVIMITKYFKFKFRAKAQKRKGVKFHLVHSYRELVLHNENS